MGFSVSWVAIETEGKASILEELKLQETQEVTEEPLGEYLGVELASGYYVIYFNDFEGCNSIDLAKVSKKNVVYSAKLSEGIMYSESSCWVNGKEKWFTSHNPSISKNNLINKGELPSTLNSMITSASSEAETKDPMGSQSDVPPFLQAIAANMGGTVSVMSAQSVDHYFDIPLKLTAEITGFNYGTHIPSGFTVLASSG